MTGQPDAARDRLAALLPDCAVFVYFDDPQHGPDDDPGVALELTTDQATALAAVRSSRGRLLGPRGAQRAEDKADG